MRLDGDIICQQNELHHWQAEGTGSFDDVRSVCSCTALTCDPFHIRAKSRLKRQNRRDTLGTLETEDIGGGTRCSTTMKWYSTDSLHTAQRSPIHIPETNYSDMTKLTEIANHHNVNKKSNLVIIHSKKNSKKGHSIIILVHKKLRKFTNIQGRIHSNACSNEYYEFSFLCYGGGVRCLST